MDSYNKKIMITIFSLPTIIYTIFFSFMRPLDEYGILFSLLFSPLILVLVWDIKLLRNLLPFYIFSLAILTLSIYHLMPNSWTHYRDTYAALRQWSWLPILTLSATIFYYIILYHWNFIRKNCLTMAIFLFIVSRSLRYFFYGFDPNPTGIDSVDLYFFIYGLDNENSAIFLLMVIYILNSSRSLAKSILVGILLVGLCSSASSRAAALFVLLMLIPIYRKQMLAGLTVVAVLFVVISQNYAYEMFAIDRNTAVRAVLWRDAALAVTDTNGIGVGYGTEYIRNDFRSIPAVFDRYIKESSKDRLFVGTHSTIYDVMLRVGVLGFAILIAGLWTALKGQVFGDRYRRLYLGLIGVMIINNSFNMGLASINLTYGAGLFFAMIMAARDLSQRQASRKAERKATALQHTRRTEIGFAGRMPPSRKPRHGTVT